MALNFVTSSRGKPILSHLGHSYYLRSSFAKSANWLCTENKKSGCRGRAVTNAEKTSVTVTIAHSCEADIARDEVRIALDRCKRRARDEPTPVRSIYESEMAALLDRGSVKQVPNFSSVKAGLYRRRQHSLPGRDPTSPRRTYQYRDVAGITPHNHPAESIEAQRLRSEMRLAAANTSCKPSQIVSMALGGASEEAQRSVGQLASIKRNIRQIRFRYRKQLAAAARGAEIREPYSAAMDNSHFVQKDADMAGDGHHHLLPNLGTVDSHSNLPQSRDADTSEDGLSHSIQNRVADTTEGSDISFRNKDATSIEDSPSTLFLKQEPLTTDGYYSDIDDVTRSQLSASGYSESVGLPVTPLSTPSFVTAAPQSLLVNNVGSGTGRHLTSRSKRRREGEPYHTFSRVASREEDEFDAFGRNVALQLKQIPLEYALELQTEVQRLMMFTRLKLLSGENEYTEHCSTDSSSESPQVGDDAVRQVA